jgi:hypothetical protein
MSRRTARDRASDADPPAVGRRRRSGAQERFYVGRRAERAEVYVVTLRDVDRLRPPSGHGYTAFDWGPAAERRGAELAAFVLGHTTGRRAPEPACAQFDLEVVAALPDAGFVIGCDDVALWLTAAGHDPAKWRHAESRGLRHLLAGALATLGSSFAAHPGAGGAG